MERHIYVLADENNTVVDFKGVPQDGYVLKSNYKNASYLAIGFSIDDENEGFVPPKPYPSWVYDINAGIYVAPVPYPAQPDSPKAYAWDEATTNWVEITTGNIA
jgi:hypothetical protein